VSAAAELAERALAAVPGDREALAHAEGERSLMLRFARSRPTQSTAVADASVEVAVVCDGHVGRATTNAADDDALAACGAQAAAAAEAAARAGGSGLFPSFATGQAPRAHEGHDRETARLDPATGAAALEAAFAAGEAEGVEAHGIWTVGEVDRAVASSSGGTLAEQLTDAFMKVVCIGPSGRSGYASAAAARVSGIDPEALAKHAAALAAVEDEAADVQAGELPVVFEPAAVGELLDLLGRCAFNGLLHAEGQGALSGRLGTRVAAPAINLSDSPRLAATLPRSFDAEGSTKSPLPLIQDGVAHGVAHDITSATLAGKSSTGHAAAPGGDSYGPGPTNMVMVGGGAADAAELAAPVERGLYVTRLWYGNVVRSDEALVTAVTRDGTFLIEEGEITRPAHDMRLTDDALSVLANVQELRARPELVSDGEFYGRRFARGSVCPAVRSGSVRFSGRAG
jgi:PmbA protein